MNLTKIKDYIVGAIFFSIMYNLIGFESFVVMALGLIMSELIYQGRK